VCCVSVFSAIESTGNPGNLIYILHVIYILLVGVIMFLGSPCQIEVSLSPPYRSVYVHHCSPIHCICLVSTLSTPTQHIISWPHLTWKTLKAKANDSYQRAVAIWTQPGATFGQPSAEIYTEGRAHYEISKLDSLIADLWQQKMNMYISNNIWAWNDVQRTEPLPRWFLAGLLQL
jgi:hypothetical protein